MNNKPKIIYSLLLFCSQIIGLGCSNSSSQTLANQNNVKSEIEIFRNEHLYFQSGDNKRKVIKTQQLPSNDEFDTVTLAFDLSCPNDRCDWWDRSGELTVLDENGNAYEILRFKTPYRVGANWSIDVSNFLPLLRGKKEFVVFIDTWVKPGSSQGDGWLVNAQLIYENTRKVKKATEVIPIFTPDNQAYGKKDKITELSKTISASKPYDSATLITYITGHGQGNSQNCAEFCPKTHTISLAGNSINQLVWRDDCSETVTKGVQMGTWKYSRAGWCPGDKVDPILLEIDTLAEGPWQFSWKPETYTNNLDENYDNNGHTRPYYRFSSYLVLYDNIDKAK